MCGIAGIFSFSQPFDPERERACRAMLDSLRHRGPDSGDLVRTGSGVLGHRRLSIIDLSEAAKQPISNEDDSVWLAYNGEIYNFQELRRSLLAQGHRFKSLTDSEVIVHLYEQFGPDCVNRLRGMFAFAIWDERKRRLFLARDRFGIKPLYYAQVNQTFLFSSEVRALLTSGMIPSEYEPHAISQFLQQGSVPAPGTLFRYIRCLEPGHVMIVTESSLATTSYWDLARVLEKQDEKPLLRNELHSLFSETVRQHLVSDVPLGILLSGGLDSSALAAYASKMSERPIHTLTVSFQEGEYDEARFAKKVSDHCRTQHHEYVTNPPQVICDAVSFIRAMDQPSVDGFNTYLVTKAAKEIGLRVLLSGLGGDELFGGYAHFKQVGLLFSLHRFLSRTPSALRKMIIQTLVSSARWAGKKAAQRLNYLTDSSLDGVYRTYRGLFPPREIQHLLDCDAGFIESDRSNTLKGALPDFDQAVWLEYRHYLHDQLLRDTDVMSMNHSIEMRVPFLDHTLVSSILARKASLRFDPHQHKKWLKELVRGELPEVILKRPKQGFVLPLDNWLRTALKQTVQDVLFDRDVSTPGFPLNPKAIRQVWEDFLAGNSHWSLPWALFILKFWMRENSHLAMSREVRAEEIR